MLPVVMAKDETFNLYHFTSPEFEGYKNTNTVLDQILIWNLVHFLNLCRSYYEFLLISCIVNGLG